MLKNIFQKYRIRIASLGAIALLYCHPSNGTGVDLCWFKNIFPFDCPGCGLLRSLSSLLHFQVTLSFHYHWLGWLALLLLFFSAITNRAPENLSKWYPFKKFNLPAKYFNYYVLFILTWLVNLTFEFRGML